MIANTEIDAIMIKMQFDNHEIWRTCHHCGEVWDARKSGLKCPKCKKNLQH